MYINENSFTCVGIDRCADIYFVRLLHKPALVRYTPYPYHHIHYYYTPRYTVPLNTLATVFAITYHIPVLCPSYLTCTMPYRADLLSYQIWGTPQRWQRILRNAKPIGNSISSHGVFLQASPFHLPLLAPISHPTPASTHGT